MQHPTPDQPGNTNSLSEPMQIQTIQPKINNPPGGYSGQQLQRLTSTSEQDQETHNNTKNKWRVIRSIKRKKIHRIKPNPPPPSPEKHKKTQPK
jgi:hypothetical protein